LGSGDMFTAKDIGVVSGGSGSSEPKVTDQEIENAWSGGIVDSKKK